jgi:acyl transferase domain-containing protein
MSDVRMNGNSVAIVGLAGRFPGAPSAGDFWKNLAAGVESLTEFSEEQLKAAGVPPQVYSQDRYVRRGTVLENTDLFDAGFFGLSPREAEILDPQHRLFLECSWEAIENAGYAPQHYPGAVGVYAGVSMNTYMNTVLARNPEVAGGAGGYQLMLGNDKDFLATRVSYKLNLRGPSIVIQTACSTSLVAIQTAYQALTKHQCDLALAGGASLFLPERAGYLYQEGMIFSPDGHCRPFDAKGKGIRAGPGVGIVVLKRLEDALKDGDNIRAVIRGAAINNDGSGKVGYTAPSVDGQAEVIATAQALAGVEPDTISYIEAHGTGTPLGDPIEVTALTQVFRARTDRKQFCAIGSVKSNIGHLDAAAGVAGLIKTVLSLEHKAIPPSLNFETPNPAIDFAGSPFFVNTKLTEWKSGGTPRRAGVSSFGIGGTNAHVVLEEAPMCEASDPTSGDQLLVLSAKSRAALDKATGNLGSHLEEHPEANIADVAYTLQCGREPFAHRRVVIGRDRAELAAAIAGSDPQRVLSSGQETRPRRVVFMFSGQGSQYVNMGVALYRGDEEFRRNFDECAEQLKPHLDRDIREIIYPASGATEQNSLALNQTGMAQPALFTIEYALAKMWISRGIKPDAMIGHSIGEYAAACISGVLSLPDAAALVAARGRLMQALPAGSMLSVSLSEKELSSVLNGHGSVAAVNAPELCTVSGQSEQMAALETTLASRGITCRRLHTSHAFHSAMMDPVLEPFRETFKKVRLSAPKIPFISNRTGTWITEHDATSPEYWVQHLRNTVRFADGLAQLAHDGDFVFLEIGPGNALGTFAKQALGVAGAPRVLASLPHAKEAIPDDRFATTALGRMWLQGVTVDWAAIHRGKKRHRVPLPSYPFERQRYWVDPAPVGAASGVSAGLTLGKRPDIAEWFYAPSWKLSTALDLADSGELPEGEWLIFADECGLASAVAQRLAAAGAPLTTVRFGTGFENRPDGSFTIDPSDRDQYGRLIQQLHGAGRTPRWILHFWNVTPSDVRGDSVETVERGQIRSYYSLQFLAQAFAQHGMTSPLQLTVISNGMQGVLQDGEITDPSKATLLGPVTVLPQDMPNVACRSVDLELVTPGSTAETSLVNWLVREASLQGAAESVAYRSGRRWERTYESVRLAAATPGKLPATRQNGVYLITGGTGGLGLVFARAMARSGNPILILTARTALPSREEWDSWLSSHPDGDKIAKILREIRQMEGSGARVRVMAADVADAARMRDVIASITAEFGAIHGVIHAAGNPGGGIVQMKTKAAAATVLDPKVRGTLILESLFRETPLDFFILFSSINAVYSPAGAADYCSANAFLDAFARSRASHTGARIISVNWDPWQEVGMAANTEVPADQRAARLESLQNGIAPTEGVEAMARVLTSRLPQVVVSTRDLTLTLEFLGRMRLARGLPAQASDAIATTAAPSSNGARHPRPDLPTPFVAPRNEQEEKIAAIWSGLLGIDQIGIHDNFFDLGGHSLLATRVLARLQDTAGVNLSLETVFDAPTVAQMSDRITTLRWVSEAPTSSSQSGDREEFEL